MPNETNKSEHMGKMANVKEETVKSKKKKNPTSKIFKHLLFCIFNGLHEHMLCSNKEKTEFEVKLRDKKNKKEWKDTDISLFVDLDSVSSKRREEKKYAEKTKNRFKSNMTKLVKAKCLEYLGERKEPKSIVIRKYRILKYPDIALVQKGSDKKFNEFRSETITKSDETRVQNTFNSGTVSDYSCLSGEYSKINLVENSSFVKTEEVEYCNVSLVENVYFLKTENMENNNVSLGENVSFVNTGNMGNHNVSLGENVSFVNTEKMENCNLLLCDSGSNELGAFKNAMIPPGSLFSNQDISDFSFLDDNTLFGENEKIDYYFMDPLLSSAMERDESPGLSPTSDWHSDSQFFNIDENMSDVIFN